jgi:PHD/YefM family antitoxin component YafN of YafNO toxin-antitoxin module
MFRIDQILSATTFVRSFREVGQRLDSTPEPLLITQKDARFIVIVDGEFFEGIMSAQYQLQSMRDAPESSHLCDLKS